MMLALSDLMRGLPECEKWISCKINELWKSCLPFFIRAQAMFNCDNAQARLAGKQPDQKMDFPC